MYTQFFNWENMFFVSTCNAKVVGLRDKYLWKYLELSIKLRIICFLYALHSSYLSESLVLAWSSSSNVGNSLCRWYKTDKNLGIINRVRELYSCYGRIAIISLFLIMISGGQFGYKYMLVRCGEKALEDTLLLLNFLHSRLTGWNFNLIKEGTSTLFWKELFRILGFKRRTIRVFVASSFYVKVVHPKLLQVTGRSLEWYKLLSPKHKKLFLGALILRLLKFPLTKQFFIFPNKSLNKKVPLARRVPWSFANITGCLFHWSLKEEHPLYKLYSPEIQEKLKDPVFCKKVKEEVWNNAIKNYRKCI